MSHRYRNYARFIQKELGIPYSTALRCVESHIEEARKPGNSVRVRLLELCKEDDERRAR